MNIDADLILKRFQSPVTFKTRRQEIIFNMVKDINKLREGTKFKPTTERILAIRINSHPILKRDTDELELIYKECSAKQNYSKLFWLLPK